MLVLNAEYQQLGSIRYGREILDLSGTKVGEVKYGWLVVDAHGVEVGQLQGVNILNSSRQKVGTAVGWRILNLAGTEVGQIKHPWSDPVLAGKAAGAAALLLGLLT
ncbi:hypothetical protein ACIBHY_29835 [Nonomuraea sp. NPDC050547]|uniref:hypothetical protein n=1 Tax=Nonomuraea sp. NPDC050547 TaxID=3364368 RepID=UPI00378DCDE3